MTENIDRVLSNVSSRSIALFLDFDGTLVNFAATPDGVDVSRQLKKLLCGLHIASQEAFALVTGRSHDSIVSLVSETHFIYACEHGSDLHIPNNSAYRDLIDGARKEKQSSNLLSVDKVRDLAKTFAEENSLRSESKKHSITLHYRQRPEFESSVISFVESLQNEYQGFTPLFGNHVVELRFDSENKGSVIAHLMKYPPFVGKTPVFIGDDVTDEHGFASVNDMQGISIKVGEGDTLAKYRLHSVEETIEFLTEFAKIKGQEK